MRDHERTVYSIDAEETEPKGGYKWSEMDNMSTKCNSVIRS